MKPDKDLDGDLAMELVELIDGNNDASAEEIVRLIREMIQQEVSVNLNRSRQEKSPTTQLPP